MSYSPNDFFWVSVSGDYDLTQCESMVRPKQIIHGTMSAAGQADRATPDCPCATTPPPPVTAPPMELIANLAKVSNIRQGASDSVYMEVCKNYVYSNDLTKLQTEASAGNELFFDIRGKYNTLVAQITNLCIGISAIGILAMVSVKAG